MKTLFASAAILALSAGSALAAEPIGDWLVKDGYAHIRIDNCAGKLWGIVAWEKTPGGLDKENPDVTKKSRPTLGMPILMGLAPTKPNRWEGEIYNSQDGKMYTANVSMADDDTLELEGCLVWPLCLTQKWTRVKTPPPNVQPLPPLQPVPGAPPAAAPGTQAKKGAASAAKGVPAAAAQSEVCMRIAAETPVPNGTKGAQK